MRQLFEILVPVINYTDPPVLLKTINPPCGAHPLAAKTALQVSLLPCSLYIQTAREKHTVENIWHQYIIHHQYQLDSSCYQAILLGFSCQSTFFFIVFQFMTPCPSPSPLSRWPCSLIHTENRIGSSSVSLYNSFKSVSSFLHTLPLTSWYSVGGALFPL